ncbi:hypothetical protein MMC06_004767 [Schaereria dolodes]|nr:hypothetical protein [Schaereria dolodes]
MFPEDSNGNRTSVISKLIEAHVGVATNALDEQQLADQYRDIVEDIIEWTANMFEMREEAAEG